MNPAGIGFLGLSLTLILSAVWTVTARKPVYSVVGLLVHFAALAAMFITLSAEFLGVVQIIVYSGAILVLFLFVIALLSSGVAPFSVGPDRLPWATIPAIALVLVACSITVAAVGRIASGTPHPSAAVVATTAAASIAGEANAFGSVADFGKALFTIHLLPFEITAFILMVAVIGVILLAGDQTPYMPSRERVIQVQRELREAILREGEE